MLSFYLSYPLYSVCDISGGLSNIYLWFYVLMWSLADVSVHFVSVLYYFDFFFLSRYEGKFVYILCCHPCGYNCYESGPQHSTKKPVTTMLTYPWKCTVLHCNHLGNTWKPLVLMTWHFDYCPSASKGDNQSVRSSAPVVSRCFPGGYNVKLYISRGTLAWWLLAFFAQ